MRLVITQPDLPHLKQLSYALAEGLNARLEALKASIIDDDTLAELGVGQINLADHPSLRTALEQHLGKPISPNLISVSEIKELLIQQLPKKIGSTTIQVAIAQALGCKDWGTLVSKAKHGHAHASSQFETLYGEACVTEFSGRFFDAARLPDGLIQVGDLKLLIMRALESIHSPGSLQFSSEKHCLVIGSKSFVEGEALARRVAFARDAGDQIVLITSAANKSYIKTLGVSGPIINQQDVLNDFKSLPCGTDVVIVCEHDAMITACQNVLLCANWHDEESKRRQVHIVMPELAGHISNPAFRLLIAQARGLLCFIGAGLATNGVTDLTGLKHIAAGSVYDIVCSPGAPAEIKALLGVDAQLEGVTHHVGALSGRSIRRIRRSLS